MGTGRKVLLAIQVVITACTLVAYLSPYVHPARSSIPGLLSLFFPFLIIAHLFFTVLWIALKQYYALISLAVLALGWSHVLAYYQIGGSGGKEPSDEISLATYNSYQFNKVKASSGKIPTALKDAIDAMGNPDVLCLQESAGAFGLNSTIGYPYSKRVRKSFTMIYSDYPIVRDEVLDLSPNSSLSGSYDISVKGDTIRVYLLHLASNRITVDSEQLLDDPDLQDRSTWAAMVAVLRKYALAARVRGDQADKIAQHIAQSPHPVVVCGDFNDVPLSYTYATIKKGLNDSFVQCGKGMSTTYAGRIPWLRIDYVLGSPEIEFTSHTVHKLDMSDHLPVVAKFQLKD